MRFKKCNLALGLILASSCCFGQERVNIQPWFDITLYNEYSDQIEFYGDAGLRHYLYGDFPWNRYYIRPAIKYTPLPWLGIRGGIGLFYTDNTEEFANTLELRPFQGVSIGWPKYSWVRFSHYFRVEERIQYNTQTWDRSFNMRYRYQFSTRIQPNVHKSEHYVYFPLFWEIFAQDKETEEGVVEFYANKNRIGTGIGYTINKYWSAQFVFIFQRSRTQDGNFKTDDYILRFQVKHELVPARDMKRVTGE